MLVDVRRAGIGVRELVSLLENALVDLLAQHGITASARADAPGVYVGEAKIASLGLRIRRGCSFHGLALNIDMDLQPFSRINPCGYQGLAITRMADFPGPVPGVEQTGRKLGEILAARLGYQQILYNNGGIEL